jgi:glycosyltransferase involved in cell wall biosynthesis
MTAGASKIRQRKKPDNNTKARTTENNPKEYPLPTTTDENEMVTPSQAFFKHSLFLVAFFVLMIPLAVYYAFSLKEPPDDNSILVTAEPGKSGPLKILFVHQNFPAQFKFLAPALAEQGHDVTALHRRPSWQKQGEWNGVKTIWYPISGSSTSGMHPWVIDFESKIIRAEACMQAANRLKEEEGYAPDVIVAHPGWGESLFLKDIWPHARMGLFYEFYDNHEGLDLNFDPEFPSSKDDGDCKACRLRMKNLNNQMHFEMADAAISPTQFQASTFPEPYRTNITVVFDGIDTVAVKPDPQVSMSLKVHMTGESVTLTRQSEVVTFVNRNLEPHRGYHIFMRALPNLLKRRPNARIMIVGGTGGGYGITPDAATYGNGRTWKDIFIQEVRHQVSDADWSRIHFIGTLSHATLIQLLQLSTVHVYLTYPFVLSWSLVEAMSAGCAIVASNTLPVREVIQQGRTGRLVDFFNVKKLTDEICSLLDDPTERARLGANAREFARQNYDLDSVCLPRQLQWVYELAGSKGWSAG